MRHQRTKLGREQRTRVKELTTEAYRDGAPQPLAELQLRAEGGLLHLQAGVLRCLVQPSLRHGTPPLEKNIKMKIVYG